MADEKLTFILAAKDTASGAVRGLKDNLTGLSSAAAKANPNLSKTASITKSMRGDAKAVAASYVGIGAGIGVLATGLATGVKALIDQERLTAQTEAVIRSTGGAAEVTSGQIVSLSEGMEDLTTIEREVVQEAANMLLTFTNIRNEDGLAGGVFDQATEAAANLSVALGKDMTDSALMVGKALNDPVGGLLSLTRAGIQFTDQQKGMIKAMVESGDLLGAQTIILGELETQFGGSAEAFADTTAGRVARFQNDVGDMFESIAVGATKVADFLGQEVDLWPFDDVPDQIADSMTQVNNAVAANLGGTRAIIEGGAETMREAVGIGITDPILDEMLLMEENANLSGHQVVIKYAAGLLTPQTDVETAIQTALQVVEDEMSRTAEYAYLSGQLVVLEEARGLASAQGKTASITAIDAAMAVIRERMGVLPGEAYSSGYGVVTEYSKGMWAGIWQISDAANAIASTISNVARIESEPPDHNSPLYGITKWGGNIAKTLAGGMLDELGTLKHAAQMVTGALVPGALGTLGIGGAMTYAGGASGGGGMTLVYSPQFSTATPSEAQHFAKVVLPELVREGQRQGKL